MTDRGPQAAAVAILFLVLTWLSVALRVYVRGIMTNAFGVDDSLAVLALFLFTFYCAFVLDGVHYGTGKHFAELSNQNFIYGMKAWWIAEIGYVSSTTVLKISIAFFLLRVCVKRFQRIIIWVVLAVVTSFSIYYFFLVIFQCNPSSYFWNQYDGHHHGKCVSGDVVSGSTYTHGALSALADWTLGVLPISLVWDLKMNPRTKISVAMILALGALGSTATIVRLPFIHQLTETTDFLFANVDVSIWSTVEPGIGITASSMATLRPLFVTFLSRSRLLGSSTRSRSTSHWRRSHTGYFRNGTNNDNAVGDEEMHLDDLRRDLPKGSGVSTTIQSVNDTRQSADRAREKELAQQNGEVENAIKRIQRFGGMRQAGAATDPFHKAAAPSGSWNSHESHLAGDSSSDDGNTPPDMGIRKTTEVTTMYGRAGKDEP